MKEARRSYVFVFLTTTTPLPLLPPPPPPTRPTHREIRTTEDSRVYFIDHNSRQTTWNDPRKTTRRSASDTERRTSTKRAFYLGPGERDWKAAAQQAAAASASTSASASASSTTPCPVSLTVTPVPDNAANARPHVGGYAHSHLTPHSAAGHHQAPAPAAGRLRSHGGVDEDAEDAEVGFLVREYAQALSSAEVIHERFEKLRASFAKAVDEKEAEAHGLRRERGTLLDAAAAHEREQRTLQKQVDAMRDELAALRAGGAVPAAAAAAAASSPQAGDAAAAAPSPSPSPPPHPLHPSSTDSFVAAAAAAAATAAAATPSPPRAASASAGGAPAAAAAAAARETVDRIAALVQAGSGSGSSGEDGVLAAVEKLVADNARLRQTASEEKAQQGQREAALAAHYNQHHTAFVGWLCGQQRTLLQKCMAPDTARLAGLSGAATGGGGGGGGSGGGGTHHGRHGRAGMAASSSPSDRRSAALGTKGAVPAHRKVKVLSSSPPKHTLA